MLVGIGLGIKKAAYGLRGLKLGSEKGWHNTDLYWLVVSIMYFFVPRLKPRNNEILRLWAKLNYRYVFLEDGTEKNDAFRNLFGKF